MNTAFMRVNGEIVSSGAVSALMLQNSDPYPRSANLIYLRFAFVTRGSGGNVFPSFVLDDWGREIRGLKLYDWVRKNGERFPRGEIFGYEEDGRKTQCFVRELELYARLPTYAYKREEDPVTGGILINAILLPGEVVLTPQQISKPADMKQPLQSAFVTWWHVSNDAQLKDLDLQKIFPEPGY